MKHADLVRRMGEISTELEILARHDKLSGAQSIQAEAIYDEFGRLDEARKGLERDADIAKIRGAMSGTNGSRLVPGSQRDGDRSGPEFMQRTDPWESEAGVFRQSSTPTELRSRALTAVERAPGGVADSVNEYVSRALESDPDPDSRLARYVIESSQPDYLRAFTAWIRNPERGHLEWTPEERAAYKRVQDATRAMSLGTTTAGGFLVPYALDPQILISGTGSVNPMRDVARVEITAQNDSRFVTSAQVAASWDAEAAEVSDDTPVLAQPPITAFKGAAFLPVSIELAEDSPNLPQQLGVLFVDAKAQLEATAFTTGAGSTEPKGIITAIAAVGGSVVISAGSALAVADITANQAALPARWRANAKFMANLLIINQGRVLPKYSNGPAVVDDSTTPPKMFGWQLLENSTMDGTIAAGTTNDYCLLSGDFKQYCIVDRVGATVEYVPHLFHTSNNRPSGQRGFYMHWRTGGDALITDAFRLTNYSA
jgi:HK97 family phage major capsid protein